MQRGFVSYILISHQHPLTAALAYPQTHQNGILSNPSSHYMIANSISIGLQLGNQVPTLQLNSTKSDINSVTP
jgi:hypothetical protein